jgi:hypothetical protein
MSQKGKCTFEVKCSHPLHQASKRGTACSRTRTAKGPEHIPSVLRRLKWWALAGLTLASKEAHQALPFIADEELPSMEELDAALSAADYPGLEEHSP